MYNYFRLDRNKTIVWRAVWCAVTWFIWCHKNKIVFEGKQMDFNVSVELIWLKASSRLSAKVKNFSYSFYDLYVNHNYYIQTLAS